MRESWKAPDNQEWLLSRIQKIFTQFNSKGVCAGIASMSTQAILSKDLLTFNRRLKLIHDIPEENFEEEIETLKQKRTELIKQIKNQTGQERILNQDELNQLFARSTVTDALLRLEQIIDELVDAGSLSIADKEAELTRRKNSFLFNTYVQDQIENALLSLPDTERLMLDIPVFLEGLVRYQEGREQAEHLFEEKKITKNQDIFGMFPLNAAVSLEREGGIRQLRTFSGVYHYIELIQYFEVIAQAINAAGLTQVQDPIVLQLDSANHGITVGYDPDRREWSFTDANMLGTKYTLSPEIIARMVSEAFAQLMQTGMFLITSASNDDVTIFSTLMITTAKNANAYANILSTLVESEVWKSMHAMTKEKLRLSDGRGETWLYHAVRDANFVASQQLLEHGANPNQERNDGVSPIHLAVMLAMNGDLEILKLLLNNGADYNKQRRNGMTALFISVARNHSGLAQLLLQRGANPDLCLNAGETPMFIAAQSGYSEMVELLLLHNANTALPLYSSVDDLRKFAVSNRKEQEMEELINKKLLIADQIKIPLDAYIFLINENKSKPYVTVTPVEIAEVMGHVAIVQLLRQDPVNTPTVCESTSSINSLLQNSIFSTSEEIKPPDAITSSTIIPRK